MDSWSIPTDYPAFVAERFTKHCTGPEGIIHASIGIVGEIFEMKTAPTRQALLEEAGDLEFYIQALRFDAKEVVSLRPGGLLMVFHDMECLAQDILDAAKKHWVYAKELSDLVEPKLYQLESHLCGLYEIIGVSRPAVIFGNMEKLTKRYPTGYTDALARARLDKVGQDDDRP